MYSKDLVYHTCVNIAEYGIYYNEVQYITSVDLDIKSIEYVINV